MLGVASPPPVPKKPAGASLVVAQSSATISTVCFPFAGGTIGGSHISAVKLIRALDRTHFRPLVMLHRNEGQLPDFLRSQGVPFECAPTRHFLGTSWGLNRAWNAAEAIRGVASQLRLARFLRQHHVRIVHTNDGAMHMTWALPAILAGSNMLWHHRAGPEGRGLRYLAPLVADGIASVSHFALSKAGPRARALASVVYSPFDTEQPIPDRNAAHASLTSELGLPRDSRIIGFFGNIADRKRPLKFVDMLAALRATAPDVHIAGLMFGATLDRDLEAEVLRRATHHRLGGRFRLMGFRQPVASQLAGCDIHVVTAMEEPFGRSLIEAMLVGTPVVAVASGGNIEAIDDGVTGCLVAPDDPLAMARSIADLFAAPDRLAALARQARVRAVEDFGISLHADQIAGMYRAMLGHGFDK